MYQDQNYQDECEQMSIIFDFIDHHKPSVREWVEVSCLTHSQLVDWFLNAIDQGYQINESDDNSAYIEISAHDTVSGVPYIFEFSAEPFNLGTNYNEV